MKKLFLVLLFILVSAPCQAIQDGGDYSQFSSSSYKEEKIYDSTGSLQGYVKPQSGGKVKTYNKYHQVNGYYKKTGSKVKYYPKK